MKSLFEKEEREEAINKLQINLLSRFYPFSIDQLIEYEDVLNWGGYGLMSNEEINWTIPLIKKFEKRIDWGYLYKICNLTIDADFIRTFSNNIDCYDLQLCKNINWEDDLFEVLGCSFGEKKIRIRDKEFMTREKLRKYKNNIDWNYISRFIALDFDEKLIDEFFEYWDWEKLSENSNLPLTVDFINKYKSNLDFCSLSRNPAALPLIFQYPQSSKWDWANVILNPGISYNQANFDFFLKYFTKNCIENSSYYRFLQSRNLNVENYNSRAFIERIFTSGTDINFDFFINHDRLSEFIPWGNINWYSNLKLSLNQITELKDKLDFNHGDFIRKHSDIITPTFLETYSDYFSSDARDISYFAPLNPKLLQTKYKNVDLRKLSSNENFDWSIEFIRDNLDKLNFFTISHNRGIYNKLISEINVTQLLKNSFPGFVYKKLQS